MFVCSVIHHHIHSDNNITTLTLIIQTRIVDRSIQCYFTAAMAYSYPLLASYNILYIQ